MTSSLSPKTWRTALKYALGHVDGDSLKGCMGALEPLQEPDEGLGIFAFLSVQQGAAAQVEDHRHVDMALSQGKLVHGDIAHLGELSCSSGSRA